MTEEDDLKRAFSALREFDEEQTPPYDTIRNRRARERAERDDSWITGGWVPGGALALAVVAAALLWLWDGDEPGFENTTEWAAGQWVMPTDVLLDLSTIPGNYLLYEVPNFDMLSVAAPDGAYQSSPQGRIRV